MAGKHLIIMLIKLLKLPQDTAVYLLRDCGWDKLDSIRAIRSIYSVDNRSAKEIVFLSPAWRDSLERDLQLHNLLLANESIVQNGQ